LSKSREKPHEALDQYEAFSSQDEKMMYINSSDTNIVMFSTETTLRFLSEPDIHLFGDGTFQYCPKVFFYQLYTIHAYKNGQYIPCVFFLLTDKSKITYTSINWFQHLVHSCSEVGVDLKMTVLHLDFVIAVHEAVRQT
jgi:hypothetical protein